MEGKKVLKDFKAWLLNLFFFYLVADGAPNLDVSSLADAKSLEEFTSHMVLHLSDEDEEEEEENEKVFVVSVCRFHNRFINIPKNPKL